MKKSASEVIRNLEMRIAHLEKVASFKELEKHYLKFIPVGGTYFDLEEMLQNKGIIRRKNDISSVVKKGDAVYFSAKSKDYVLRKTVFGGVEVEPIKSRTSRLEKRSARRPKTLAQTISELNSAIKGDLDRKEPKLFARLSRDPRVSKELQSAFRNFHKQNEKLRLIKRTIWDLGKLELDALMDSGYSSEIARVVNICKDVLSNLRIEYKGKRVSISPYLTFEEGRGSYALEVNFKSGQFERRNWGRPGNFMARGTWVSTLNEEESEELDLVIGREATRAIDAALPGFSSSLRNGPSNLGLSGYRGADWDIPKEEIIKYLDSL